MKVHSDAAHATLKSITGRDGFRAQLERYDSAASSRVGGVTKVSDDIYFYEKRGLKDDQFKLFMRRGLQGAEKLLFDPETLKKKTGKPHAINYYTPSPDGKKVALGVSAAGSEEADLRVLDTASGRQIGPVVTRAQFGAISWTPDSQGLFFHRMQAQKKGAPATEKYQRSFAVANPRGSGVFGRAWHEAGKQVTARGDLPRGAPGLRGFGRPRGLAC